MSSHPMVNTFPTRQQARTFLRLVRQFHLAVPVGNVQLTADGGHAVGFNRPVLTLELWRLAQGDVR